MRSVRGVLFGSGLSLVAVRVISAEPGIGRSEASKRTDCRSWVVACEDTLTSLHSIATAAALCAAFEIPLAVAQYETRERCASRGAICDYYRAACASG